MYAGQDYVKMVTATNAIIWYLQNLENLYYEMDLSEKYSASHEDDIVGEYDYAVLILKPMIPVDGWLYLSE